MFIVLRVATYGQTSKASIPMWLIDCRMMMIHDAHSYGEKKFILLNYRCVVESVIVVYLSSVVCNCQSVNLHIMKNITMTDYMAGGLL